MKCKHTGLNIRNLTTDIIEKLDISEKFYQMITEYASNIVKAY
jgi:hypothetical protein